MFDTVEVMELVGKAAGWDARLGSDAELLEGAVVLQRVRGLVDAADAHVLAELDARGTCDREFGMRTGGWVAREAGLPCGVTAKRVQVARRLRATLPEVDEALSSGVIGWDHARVLADAAVPRIEDKVAAIQAELVGLAQGRQFDWWRREVAGIVDLLDDDGGHDPDDDLERSELSASRSFGGMVGVTGKLFGLDAETAWQALERVTDELYRDRVRDHKQCSDNEVPTRRQLRAMAFIELIRRGLAVDIHSTKAPKPEIALVAQAGDPTDLSTPDGIRLADGSFRVLSCDPVLYPLVINSLGVPLDMGIAERFATATQRRAMAMRDGGCVYPGCTKPISWCDAHHVIAVTDGGPTDLSNMALLCRYHHGVTHRTGWTMHATTDQWFWWQPPTQEPFWSQRHGKPRQGPTPQPPPTPAAAPTAPAPGNHGQRRRTTRRTGDPPDRPEPGQQPPPCCHI